MTWPPTTETDLQIALTEEPLETIGAYILGTIKHNPNLTGAVVLPALAHIHAMAEYAYAQARARIDAAEEMQAKQESGR